MKTKSIVESLAVTQSILDDYKRKIDEGYKMIDEQIEILNRQSSFDAITTPVCIVGIVWILFQVFGSR